MGRPGRPARVTIARADDRLREAGVTTIETADGVAHRAAALVVPPMTRHRMPAATHPAPHGSARS